MEFVNLPAGMTATSEIKKWKILYHKYFTDVICPSDALYYACNLESGSSMMARKCVIVAHLNVSQIPHVAHNRRFGYRMLWFGVILIASKTGCQTLARKLLWLIVVCKK